MSEADAGAEQPLLLQSHGAGNSRLVAGQYLILLFVDMIGPFSSDAYIPNLPDMQHDLRTNEFKAGLTIQCNWVVSGISTVMLGALSDRIGRKKTLLIGLLLYIAGTIVCSLALSIEAMLAFRTIEGVVRARRSSLPQF